MKKSIITALFGVCVLFMPVLAKTTAASSSVQEPTYIVDTPSVGMLDYGAYDLNFRLFSNGGILTRLDFGVFRIVNLGFGWEVSNVIGTQDMSAAPPEVYLKIKPFSSGLILPDFAFGYDGQGYFYDKNQSAFGQKEKGIFIVFGRELFFSGLNMNCGANMNDFKSNQVFGFINMDLNLEDKLSLLAEYDNINYLPNSRLNAGIRFFITNDLSIDLAGRDIGASGRTAERIIRIAYRGKF